jgi:phage-related protein
MAVASGETKLPREGKVLVWLSTEGIDSPPFSPEAKREAGYLLGLLREGVSLGLPASRPMPVIGRRRHELRITDEQLIHRIEYHIDMDAIVILHVFQKKTNETPQHVINLCRQVLRHYLASG